MIDLTNKKMLKEWQKIEAAGIFDTLEEFAKYYYENGEKSCFRIITNDPWSKENFFFGTYQELLDFYKNELPKRSIGRKYHSLTVLDVFKENKEGKERWYAKCQCDCGNETVKLFESLKDGNARTCGCKSGVGKVLESKITTTTLSEEIKNELWDCERNKVNPNKIQSTDSRKFWWKNNHGICYELSPKFYLPNNSSTSFPEQALFYYIKRIFNDAIWKANYIPNNEKSFEIDIYIPSLKIGIEYDGAYWHKDDIDNDNYKNRILSEEGVFVIRIREEGCPCLDPFNGVVLIRKSPLDSNNTLLDTINDTLSILEKTSPKIAVDRPTKQKFGLDIKYIKKFFSQPMEFLPISNTCLGKYWDHKENGNYSPQKISTKSLLSLNFRCKSGYRFSLRPFEFFSKPFLNEDQVFEFYKCKLELDTPCSYNECCPFFNLKICKRGALCLTLGGYGNPFLKCIDKNIFDGYSRIKENDEGVAFSVSNDRWVYKRKKSLLRFAFINKSKYPFFIYDSIAIVMNEKMMRYDYNHFSDLVLKDKFVKPNGRAYYDFIVTTELENTLLNSTLVINCKIRNGNFNPLCFSLFLILKIDSNGQIISQSSKIFPERELRDMNEGQPLSVQQLESILETEFPLRNKSKNITCEIYDESNPYSDFSKDEYYKNILSLL